MVINIKNRYILYAFYSTWNSLLINNAICITLNNIRIINSVIFPNNSFTTRQFSKIGLHYISKMYVIYRNYPNYHESCLNHNIEIYQLINLRRTIIFFFNMLT